MAKDEGVQRADLKRAQLVAAAVRRNLKTAPQELAAYWVGELQSAEAEVARLTRELES